VTAYSNRECEYPAAQLGAFLRAALVLKLRPLSRGVAVPDLNAPGLPYAGGGGAIGVRSAGLLLGHLGESPVTVILGEENLSLGTERRRKRKLRKAAREKRMPRPTLAKHVVVAPVRTSCAPV
jgi:hypothetical protein